MPDSKKSVLKNIIALLKPYRFAIFSSLFLSVLITFLCVILPNISRKLIDEGLLIGNIKTVCIFSSVIATIGLIIAILTFVQKVIHQKVQNDMQKSLSATTFEHLMKLELKYFEESSTLSLITSVNVAIREMCESANEQFLNIVLEILKMCGGIVGLAIIDIRLTPIVIFIAVVRFFFAKMLRDKRNGLFEKMVEISMEISAWCSDVLSGIRIVKLWNLSKTAEYIKLVDKDISSSEQYGRLFMAEECITAICDTLLTFGLYILGAIMVANHSLTVGGLLAFITYSSYVVSPISSFIQLGYQISKIQPSIQIYNDFLEMSEEESETTNGATLFQIDHINTINFNHVSWCAYEQIIIKDISFTLRRNETVAFVGHNGCGKSTIIDLLLRFKKPTTGYIDFDHTNIENIPLSAYRNLLAVVEQECFLFSTNVENNLLAKSPINLSDEKLPKWLVSQIMEFPQGLLTKTGQDGALVSGGEKQKITFLRGLLKENTKILILDEPTSNYDITSEKLFNKSVVEINYDYVVVVTHRPDILKTVDKIIIIDDGSIVAEGSYQELSKQKLLDKYIN